MIMEFKFRGSIFKNDPSKNKNNNPKFPTHSGTLEMPLGKLNDYVEYLHWAAKTELKYDEYLKDHVVPIKISGWATTSENTGKKYLSVYFEPNFKTLGDAIAKKQASEFSGPESLDPTVQDAAANLAKSTGGTVVQTQQDDIF